MTSGRLVWTHKDSGGDIGAAIARANQIAGTRAWTSVADPAEREAHFRAWLIGISASVSSLGPNPPAELVDASAGELAPLLTDPGKKVVIQFAQASEAVAQDFQAQLASGLVALVTGKALQPSQIPQIPDDHTLTIQTVDGETGVANETAVLPVLAIIAIVLVAGAAATAIAAMVTEAAAQSVVVDAKKQELIAAMTTSASIVDAHQAAEAAAGHPLPWDAQTAATLNSLRAAIKDTVAWEPPPLKSVPNLAGVSNATANAISNVGKGVSIGLPVAFAIAAYLYFFPRRRAAVFSPRRQAA